MSDSSIVIRGAREHNLRDIDVSIPRDQLVVITGLSGSGKSSLAFDTIYAEASVDTSRAFRVMRASSWARWTNPTWIQSTAFRRLSQLIKRRHPRTRARRLAP